MANYNLVAIAELAQSELGAKPRRALKAAEQYKRAVYDEIIYGYYILATTDQIKNNTVPFSVNRVRKRLGRYSSKNLYWWDWLHNTFPLVKIIKKGNNLQGAVSMVEPQIPLEIILKSGDTKQVVKALYSAHDLNSELHFAPINVYSLENYVLSTSSELKLDPQNNTYKQNLQDAQTILMIAQECNNQLPQIVNHSSFGRTYYRGINLQNVHKTVRHAALGNCYSVDINNAVFNWKYAVMSKETQQTLIYTRELIQDKQRIRKQLAMLVFDNASERSIKTIKQVLTAISFGAKESGKGYYYNKHWTPTNDQPKYITSSIDTIIRSPERRKRLFETPWMKHFMQEQRTINDSIYSELVQQLTSGAIGEDRIKDLRSRANRISPAKFIAWAYQHSEQSVMKQILECSRAQPLLQVHDGVYFKTKPDMPSMQTVLQDNWPLATLSIDTVENYHYRDRQIDQQHQDFIREETIKANGGVDPNTTGIHTRKMSDKTVACPHSEPDWEKVMQQQYDALYPSEDPNMPEFARLALKKPH